MIAAFRRVTLLALATVGAFSLAGAAFGSDELRTTQLAMEVPVSKLTLPATETSSALMPKCGGCPPASFLATVNTVYYEGQQRISLAEMKSVVAKYPKLLVTVSYRVSNNELMSITADIPGGADRR